MAYVLGGLGAFSTYKQAWAAVQPLLKAAKTALGLPAGEYFVKTPTVAVLNAMYDAMTTRQAQSYSPPGMTKNGLKCYLFYSGTATTPQPVPTAVAPTVTTQPTTATTTTDASTALNTAVQALNTAATTGSASQQGQAAANAVATAQQVMATANPASQEYAAASNILSTIPGASPLSTSGGAAMYSDSALQPITSSDSVSTTTTATTAAPATAWGVIAALGLGAWLFLRKGK